MKCPHCGHPDRIHAGPTAKTVPPGSCRCHPPDTPCPCPGWKYWQSAGEWQQELQMEHERVERAWGESTFTLYEPDD